MITYRSAARKYQSKELYPIISKPLIVETNRKYYAQYWKYQFKAAIY